MTDLDERLSAYFAGEPPDTAARDRLRVLVETGQLGRTRPGAGSRVRAYAVAAAIACVIAFAVALTVVVHAHRSGEQHAGTSGEHGQGIALSQRERRLAETAAFAEALDIGKVQLPSLWPAEVDGVYARAADNAHSSTNTRHACTSSRLITVTLTGKFSFPTSPNPLEPPPSAPESIVLTVDATGGQTCLVGVALRPLSSLLAGTTTLYRR
jgi:hypothetical protein